MVSTMYNWFVKGGPIMYPIFIFSIFGFMFIIERFIYFYKIRHNAKLFIEKIEKLWEEKKIDAIHKLCDTTPGPLAIMIKTGLETYKKNPDAVRERIMAIVSEESPKIEKYLSLISMIATIEPMLGLLGTVTGMIRCFTVIALKGTGDPQALAGGISEALITTEAGLIISIPMLYFHSILSDKVDNIISNMENASSSFLAMVEETI